MKCKVTDLYVYLVLFMVYLLPSGFLFGAFSSIHNHIFSVMALLIYTVTKFKNNTINKKTIYIWLIVIFVAIYTKKFGFIDMLVIPIVDEFINKKEDIKRVIKKSNILYVALAFTLLYSVLYNKLSIGGRGEGTLGSGLVFTAIGEINLTGLSLFCLSLLMMKKNKILGKMLFPFGLLTLSRSYILSLICVIFFNIKYVKMLIKKIGKYLTYHNLTMISNVALILMGFFFINLFSKNKIVAYSTTAGFHRLFNMNDYSNLFRFLAIYLVAIITMKNPQTWLTGMSDEEYIYYGKQITSSLNVPFSEIGPHNIFFSHLKIYGIAVFLEIYFISKYLKRVINQNNFGIFFAVFLYSIILGTGLYNYWLFLTVITLIVYE